MKIKNFCLIKYTILKKINLNKCDTFITNK